MIGPQPAANCTPHRGGMLLIDVMLSAEGDTARSETTIRRDNVFFQPGRGVPAYIGFEFMAQTINAFDGWRRVERGQTPTIGFLLGSRGYRCQIDYFVEGARYVTEVRSLLKNPEDEMVSFDCRIMDDSGAVVASGVVNAFRPHDVEAFLRAQLAT
jgi:predicted hotdog family 3-hydroxylacyl-ACP dehydratase